MNRRELFKLGGKVGLVALASQVPWSWLERAGLVADYEAEAAALPQYYQVRDGISMPLDTIGEWTYSSGGGSGGAIEANTDAAFLRNGMTANIKFTTAAANSTARATKTTFTTFDATNDYNWGLWYYIPDATALANFSQILVYVGNTGLTQYWQCGAISGGGSRVGWNWRAMPRLGSIWTSSGSTTWANRTTVRITVASNASGATTVYVNQLLRGFHAKPWIIWTCDDVYDTQYIWLKDEFAARGITPTCYVAAQEFPGGSLTSSRMTVAQMRELEGLGWRFGLHGDDHSNLLGLTDAQVRAQITANRAALQSNLAYPLINHLALPQPGGAATNATVEAVGQSMGIQTIRLSQTTARPLDMTAYGLFNKDAVSSVNADGAYNIHSVDLSQKALSDVQTLIDGSAAAFGAIAWGAAIGFHIHNVGTTGDADGTGASVITRANLREIANYTTRLHNSGVVRQGGLHEFYAGLTNPRRRRAA